MSSFIPAGHREAALEKLAEYYGASLNSKLIPAYRRVLETLNDYQFDGLVSSCYGNPDMTKFPKPFEFDSMIRNDTNNNIGAAVNDIPCMWCCDDGLVYELIEIEGVLTMNCLPCKCDVGRERQKGINIRIYRANAYFDKYPKGQYRFEGFDEFDQSGVRYNDSILTLYMNHAMNEIIKRKELSKPDETGEIKEGE